MNNLSTERVITLNEACRHFPGDWKPCRNTINRYVRSGVGPRNVKLEAAKIGGRTVTTIEAVGRFIQALNVDVELPKYSSDLRIRVAVIAEEVRFAIDVDDREDVMVLTPVQAVVLVSKMMTACLANPDRPNESYTTDVVITEAMARRMGEPYTDAVASLTDGGVSVVRTRHAVVVAQDTDPLFVMTPADAHDWAGKAADLLADVGRRTRKGEDLTGLLASAGTESTSQ